ncbi:MAG TPA: hypothetical protein VFA46_22840 [Actinomycetes bacterium]|jgi:hypothetical protein|nr:hypothetical protein [Actinomycetes bacterium]
MDPRSERPWGERLAEGAASVGDEGSARGLIMDALTVVRGRLGDIRRQGIQPLLDEAATQVRPATLEELRARYPGLSDDEVAHRLIARAARAAGGVALGLGGLLAAQEAMAALSSVAPPAGGTALGAVGITALAEVLVLFVLEAKLRADLGALAGQPVLSPRDLVNGVVSEVQAAGGWSKLRSGSLRRALPEAAARRVAAQIARLVPRRFARIVIPEVVAPLVGAAFAARVAVRQVRAAGERHWGQLRSMPRTRVTWGTPTMPHRPPAGSRGGNGGRPPGSHPSTWGPDPSPGGGSWRPELPPPEPPGGT